MTLPNSPITFRFYLPRNQAAHVRDQLNRPRWQERMRLREALGYLPGDRDVSADAPPALVLTALAVDYQGAAVATVTPLLTDEGRVVAMLAKHLDADQWALELVQDSHGNIEGMDFAITDAARRIDIRSALSGRASIFSKEDAAEWAALFVAPERDPEYTPSTPRDNGMIGESVIERAREMERQQAAEQARRNTRPLGFTFD